MHRRHALGAAVIAAVICLGGAFTGCSGLVPSAYDAPLPGGADVGSDPITLTAEFDDVMDLVPQSSVKVDNVAIGRISAITLQPDGETAEVEMVVRRDVRLPEGTTARLQQTSLLGEKYVALIRPERPAGANVAALEDGDLLPLDQTDAAAQVEQVLGALSLVLNGGGIAQFQEISREMQDVGGGRTEEVRAFLDELHRFVGVLDRRRASITTAIDGLAELSATLEGDQEKIATALEGLSPGMEVLVEQRPQLVKMLRSLDRLSAVTVETLDKSQDDIVADFELLDPILDRLAAAGSALPQSLQILLTYPFPDEVLAAINGDYLNVFLTTNFRTLPSGCTAAACFWPQVGGGSGTGSTQRRLPPSLGETVEPSPTVLPSTDSPYPGSPTPTVPGPSILPTESGTPGPSDPSTPDSSPTGEPGGPSESGSPGSSPSGSAGPTDTDTPGGQ
ncbi:MCE family protein [Nocardioides sp. BGMRC 2183]|nr:MCE family protein [Nocardioides sp. BGMRC 2183]